MSLGVPLATWAGDQVGWRATFWGIAGLGVDRHGALRLTLPAVAAMNAWRRHAWPSCAC
jgi:DHA1 family inner membrane transport protein